MSMLPLGDLLFSTCATLLGIAGSGQLGLSEYRRWIVILCTFQLTLLQTKNCSANKIYEKEQNKIHSIKTTDFGFWIYVEIK